MYNGLISYICSMYEKNPEEETFGKDFVCMDLGGEKKTPTLKLYPEISKKYTRDYDELSFRVGRIDEKKSFVVKDIKDFYEKLVAEDEYQICLLYTSDAADE